MTSFSARAEPPRGGHTPVAVFAGPDADHRAKCGELLMLPNEAQALVELLAESGVRA